VLLGLGQPTIGPYKPGTWVYNDAIRDYPSTRGRPGAPGRGGLDGHHGDGVLDKDGRPFEFTLMTNQGNESRIKAATIIQANWPPSACA
jgi:peptide/nickel transport system substrate-binding protein